MESRPQKVILSAALFLCVLILCVCSIAYSQTPTPTVTPNPQTTPQVSPAQTRVPPEIGAIFMELSNELRKAQTILREGQLLSVKSKADSLPARAKANEALAIYRSLNAKLDDENLKIKINKAGEVSQQLLKLLKEIQFQSKSGEGLSLDRIAATHQNLGEWQEYIYYSNLALAVYREINTDRTYLNIIPREHLIAVRVLEAQNLDNIGGKFESQFGNLEEAIKYKNQALERFRSLYQETQELKYRFEEALTLSSIGLIYGRQAKDKASAIEFLTQSLEIYRTFPNAKRNVAETLSAIANIYSSDFNYGPALKNWEESLGIYREIDDKNGQSNILHSLGMTYWVLDNQSKFKEYMNQNLAILQSPDFAGNWKKTFPSSEGQQVWNEIYDAFIESSRLSRIGSAYRWLEDYEKALEYYQKALAVSRSRKESRDIRFRLGDVAFALAKLGKWDEASAYYKQSLEISREQRVGDEIAGDLQDIGWALLESGKPTEALAYQIEALITYQSSGINDEGTFSPAYSSLLNELSRTYDALGNRRLAIVYSKRGINAIQGERQKFQSLDLVSQKGFLEKKLKHYRRLADWLIAEGRVAEAEQVLSIIKAEEYFDYVRRDPKVAEELLERLSLTDDERNALKRFEEITSRITALGKEFDELGNESKNFETGKFPKQARLDELNKEIADARAAFNKFLDELDAQFRNPAANPTDPSAVEVSTTRALLNRLNQPRTVIISTIVGENRLNLIVTTAQASHAYTVDIKAADMNKLVLKFRAAVKNPTIDPRMAGKELYDKLFPSDLQKELANVKADTIVWSLDGTLRYAPLAALWDGKQYMAEKYASSVITLASRNELKQSSSRRANWTALGVGVSQGGTIAGADGTLLEFGSLDAVPEELCSVVNDQQKKIFCTQLTKGKIGVLSGRNLADDEFTLASFKRNLGKFPVVHIASHFYLNVGSENDSFLLLGGKNEEERKLTMAAVRKELNRKFAGVELLTLSACDTAMSSGDKANGAEVESFGALAQDQGAKSVLATLWPIADPSTRDLMTALYRNLAINQRTGKAGALRQAQLALLQGTYKAGEIPLWRRGLDIKLSGVAGNQVPIFKRDAKARYAHPYYWSPFVLMGDWR